MKFYNSFLIRCKVFYTTNFPGGGTDGLFAINTRSNTVTGGPVDTPFTIPHNIALTPNGHKLYITHSGGASDKVTIYDVKGRDRTPALLGDIRVGFNPFGLAYVQ